MSVLVGSNGSAKLNSMQVRLCLVFLVLVKGFGLWF